MLTHIMSFWSSERSLSALLVLLCVQSFIIGPLITDRHLLSVISSLLFSLILLAGLLTITQHRMVRLGGRVFVAVALGVHWALLIAPSHALSVMDRVFSLCFAFGLTAMVLHEVYRSGPVTAHRIRGSVAAYLLLGYFFACAYTLLDLTTPGSFAISPTLDQPRTDHGDIFIYFSIVTLTTVGFGDVTAVHPIGRSLVMLEGLVGTLYPAILIARLVSLQIAEPRK